MIINPLVYFRRLSSSFAEFIYEYNDLISTIGAISSDVIESFPFCSSVFDENISLGEEKEKTGDNCFVV